jgi:hypothetical protein
MSPLACILAYRFPVHLIGPDYRPDEPPAEPTVLLLVRGRDDEVRFHEINALTAMLVETLQQNESLTGAECVEHALTLAGIDPSTLRAAGLATLTELQSFEAILGTAP